MNENADFDQTNFRYFLHDFKLYFFSDNSFRKIPKCLPTNLSRKDIDSLISSSYEVDGIEANQIEQALSADLLNQIQTNKEFLYTLPIPVLYQIFNDHHIYHTVDQKTISFLFEYLNFNPNGYILFDCLYLYKEDNFNYFFSQFKDKPQFESILNRVKQVYKKPNKPFFEYDVATIMEVDINSIQILQKQVLINQQCGFHLNKQIQLLNHFLSIMENNLFQKFSKSDVALEGGISVILNRIIEFYQILLVQWKIYQNSKFKQIPQIDLEKLKCTAHNLLLIHNETNKGNFLEKFELIDSLYQKNKKDYAALISSQNQVKTDEWLQTLQFIEPKVEILNPTRFSFLKCIIDDESSHFFLTRQGELSLIQKDYIEGQFERNRFINPSLTIYSVLQNKSNVLQAILKKQIKLGISPKEILFPATSNSKINLFHLSIEKNNDCFKVIYRILSENSCYFSFPKLFDWFTPTSYYTAIFYCNQDAIAYLQGFSNPFLIKDDYLDPFRLAILLGNREETEYIFKKRTEFPESWKQLQQLNFDPMDLSVSDKKNSQTIEDILQTRNYMINEIAQTKNAYFNKLDTPLLKLAKFDIFDLQPIPKDTHK